MMNQGPETSYDEADVLHAIRENLEVCREATTGPPARVVPEFLCQEIEHWLRIKAHRVASDFGAN